MTSTFTCSLNETANLLQVMQKLDIVEHSDYNHRKVWLELVHDSLKTENGKTSFDITVEHEDLLPKEIFERYIHSLLEQLKY